MTRAADRLRSRGGLAVAPEPRLARRRIGDDADGLLPAPPTAPASGGGASTSAPGAAEAPERRSGREVSRGWIE